MVLFLEHNPFLSSWLLNDPSLVANGLSLSQAQLWARDILHFKLGDLSSYGASRVLYKE